MNKCDIGYKVLPTVYDLSLSYEEQICKIFECIKKIFENINEIMDNYPDKLNMVDWINVKEVGARGNGVDNDTQAFSDAVTLSTENNNRIIYVPTGTYFITGDVGTENTFWFFGNDVKIQGDIPPISTPPELQNTNHFKGTIFYPDDKRLRIGSSGTWLETDVRPASQRVATLSSISPNGRYGLIGASRTSDNQSGIKGDGITIGVGAFGVNDRADIPQGTWGIYTEAVRSNAGSGPTIGMEIDASGVPGCQPVTPYSVITDDNPILTNLWLSCGHGDGKLGGDTSCAIGIIRNPNRHQVGICFKSDALDDNNIAIALEQNHKIMFFDQETRIPDHYAPTYSGSYMRLRGDKLTREFFVAKNPIDGPIFSASFMEEKTEAGKLVVVKEGDNHYFKLITPKSTWDFHENTLYNNGGNIGDLNNPFNDVTAKNINVTEEIRIISGIIYFLGDQRESLGNIYFANDGLIRIEGKNNSLFYSSAIEGQTSAFFPDGKTVDIGTAGNPWNRLYTKNEPQIVSVASVAVETFSEENTDSIKNALSKIKPVKTTINGKIKFMYNAENIVNAFAENGLNIDDYDIVNGNFINVEQLRNMRDYYGVN